jgi:hypothetical protein
MTVKDKGDVWGWVGPDLDHVRWEDGSVAELATDLVEMDWGREKGKLLSELTDVGYLNWMLKDAGEKGNAWQEKCVRLRLEEINNNI